MAEVTLKNGRAGSSKGVQRKALRKTAVVTITVAVLILSGCAKSASTSTAKTTTSTTGVTTTTTTAISKSSTVAIPKSTSTATPSTAPGGPYGDLAAGVATFGTETFDPVRANDAALKTILAPMYDFLVRTNSSGASAGIAEKWEMAPDGLSWFFSIRKGIAFHDGSPLTAKDVKFSLEQQTAKDAFYNYVRDAQDRVEAPDDYSVRVYTKGVQPYYPRFVNFVPANQGIMMPKEYIEKNGMTYFNLHPVGTGPWKFVSRIPGDSVTYQAVDQHYRQVPAFKKLTLIAVSEEATRMAMLKTGTLDIAEIGVDSSPDVASAGLKTVTLAGSQVCYWFLGAYDPRGKNLAASNVKMREALSLAINRDEIGRTLYLGKLEPPMPPFMWTSQPEIDVRYWKDASAQFYRYDPQAAAKLIKDAGYNDGFSIKLYAYPGTPNLPKLAEVIQGYWVKIGIKAQIVPIDLARLSSMRTSGPNRGPADELVGQAVMRANDGNVIPARALAPAFLTGSTWNLLQGAIPELDSLISSILVEPDSTKRFDMTARAIRLAMDSRAYEVIGRLPMMAGLGSRVEMDLPGGALSIVMYLEAAKQGKR